MDEEHSSQRLVESESAASTKWIESRGEETASVITQQRVCIFSLKASPPLVSSFSPHSVPVKEAVHHYSRTELIKGD